MDEDENKKNLDLQSPDRSKKNKSNMTPESSKTTVSTLESKKLTPKQLAKKLEIAKKNEERLRLKEVCPF